MNILLNAVVVTGARFIPYCAGKDNISLVKAAVLFFIYGVHGVTSLFTLIRLPQSKECHFFGNYLILVTRVTFSCFLLTFSVIYDIKGDDIERLVLS